jgi:hypothetical protein
MNLATFNLTKNGNAVSAEDVIEIINKAADKVGIVAQHIGVFFDGKHLIPSVMGMGQTHKKCEFTGAIKAQGCEVEKVRKPSKVRQAAAKSKLRDLSAADANQVEYATEYLREYGTLRIEGVGGRKTNYGNGYTLTINSGDAQDAREQAETLVVIQNSDKNEGVGVYKLTRMDEVAAAMQAVGLGAKFYSIAESIGKGEVYQRKLSEF